MKMKSRAAILDLDGTLLDTLEDLAGCMNTVLEEGKFPVHPVLTYRQFVGDGLKNLVKRSLPSQARHDAQILHSCVEAMRREYGKRWREKTRPYAGITELLQALAGKSVRLSVLSNKPHAFTCQMVREFFPSIPFQMVLGERPGVPRKPHPQGALEIARALETVPGQFLYLGDTGTDMKTAMAAGMFAVGVLWGFRDESELRSTGARLLIREPLELLEHLRS